jgi:hypothetical protein
MLGLDEEDIAHIKLVHKQFMESAVNEEMDAIRESLDNPPEGGGGRQPAPGVIAGSPTIQEEETVLE